MKHCIFLFFLFPVLSFGQISIKGKYFPRIFIGINNYITLNSEKYDCNELTLKPTDSFIQVKNNKDCQYAILVSKVQKGKILVFADNQIIDSINVNVERIEHIYNFALVKDIGLIKSGDYPKEIIREMREIVVKYNTPDKIKIYGFEFTYVPLEGMPFLIKNEGGTFNDKIRAVLKNLKYGDTIYIDRIHHKTYTCFNVSNSLVFRIK